MHINYKYKVDNMDNQPQPAPQVPPNNENLNQTPSVSQPESPQVTPVEPTNQQSNQPQPTVYNPAGYQPTQTQDGGVVTGGQVVSKPVNANQLGIDSQTKRSRLPLIIILCAVIVVLIGGTVFGLLAYSSHNSNKTSKTVSSALTGADCGKVIVTNQTFNKSPYTGCFDQHFASCTSAQITVDNESSFLKGTINQYDIKSKQGSYCLVQWQYVKLPSNASWDGKTVTCPYDNSKDFSAAFSAKTNFSGCSGPLLKVMGSSQNSSGSSNFSYGSTTQSSNGFSATISTGSSAPSNP